MSCYLRAATIFSSAKKDRKAEKWKEEEKIPPHDTFTRRHRTAHLPCVQADKVAQKTLFYCFLAYNNGAISQPLQLQLLHLYFFFSMGLLLLLLAATAAAPRRNLFTRPTTCCLGTSTNPSFPLFFPSLSDCYIRHGITWGGGWKIGLWV